MRQRLLGALWIAAFISFIWVFGLTAWFTNEARYPTRPDNCTHNAQVDNQHEMCGSLWHRTLNDPVAFFTFWLAIFSAVLTGVSLIQMWFVSRADKTARIAADAAKDSAAAATEAADISKTALLVTQRAFVFLKEMSATFDREAAPPPGSLKARLLDSLGTSHLPINTWHLSPVWQNSRSTPAQRLTISFGCREFFGAMPDDFDFAYLSPPDPSFLGPKAEVRGSGVLLSGDLLTQLNEHASRSFYVWGAADYDDVFGINPRHRTEFCFRVDIAGWDSNGLPVLIYPLHSRHNGAENECLYPPAPYQAQA